MPAGQLDGMTALVTGGSRGIGAAIVNRLAHNGAKVAFTYSQSHEKAHTVAGVNGAHAIRADSMKEAEVKNAVAQTVDQFGRLDILVNNAAVSEVGFVDEMAMDKIDQMITVNIRSVIVAIRVALPHMRPGGRIINIGSINADRTPYPGQSIYAMTKGALSSLTRGLARELAQREITVNNVQPGPIDTDTNPSVGAWAPKMLAIMASDRYGTADEVASFVAYLASPEASFITGSSLNIDGGFTA